MKKQSISVLNNYLPIKNGDRLNTEQVHLLMLKSDKQGYSLNIENKLCFVVQTAGNPTELIKFFKFLNNFKDNNDILDFNRLCDDNNINKQAFFSCSPYLNQKNLADVITEHKQKIKTNCLKEIDYNQFLLKGTKEEAIAYILENKHVNSLEPEESNSLGNLYSLVTQSPNLYLEAFHKDLSDNQKNQLLAIFRRLSDVKILFSVYYPIYDENNIFNVMLDIHNKLNDKAEVLSVAICVGTVTEQFANSFNLHWVCFSLKGDSLLFSDSFGSLTFEDTISLNRNQLQKSLSQCCDKIKYNYDELLSFFDKWQVMSSKKNINQVPRSHQFTFAEIHNNLARMSITIRNIINSDLIELSSLGIDVNSFRHFISDFLEKQFDTYLKESISPYLVDTNTKLNLFAPELNPSHISLDPFENKKNCEEYMVKYNAFLTSFKEILSLTFSRHQHSILDCLQLLSAKDSLEDLSFNLSDIISNGKISLNKAEKDSLTKIKDHLYNFTGADKLNVINSSDGQQVGGFACGYHAVMNCRTQREFFQSNYKNDSTPVYHKKLVQDELVQSLTQEHNNPDKDFYINLDKLYSKIKQEIELKAANSFLSIPNDLNINEGLKISLTGVIVGFIFAVLPWQFSAIISMLMLVIYLLKDDEEVSSLGISLDTTPETLDAEMRRQKCSMVDMQLSKDIVNTVNDDQHSEYHGQDLSVEMVK
ncbi:MAG: hypothetical protein VX335_04100 [Pseudomonadota bacterium]|nr:hypothetical protein [Pseudomonadota bacterium]